MNDQEIIQLLKDTGHLEYPYGRPQGLDSHWKSQCLVDAHVSNAIGSYQSFMAEPLDRLCMKHHSQPARLDAGVGPATRELFAQPRKGCHGIGDYHAAFIHVDKTNMPGFLRPYWDEVFDLAVGSFAELGLKFIRTDQKSVANITVSFETRRKPWIGLAQVGNHQACNSTIWAQLHAGYHPEKIVPMWTQLLQHEFGHNCGWQHTRGGIMAATLMVELPPTWIGDPIEPLAKRMYGGVPIPGPEPEPPGPSPPSDDVMVLTHRDGRKWSVTPWPEVP